MKFLEISYATLKWSKYHVGSHFCSQLFKAIIKMLLMREISSDHEVVFNCLFCITDYYATGSINLLTCHKFLNVTGISCAIGMSSE